MKKSLTIDYIECPVSELKEEDQILLSEAKKAAETAHNPYSHFFVGAALKLEDGTIVRGSNQENLAYPSGLCAERTAMFSAGANHPGKAFDTLAIIGATKNSQDELVFQAASPCGACRQVMAEYETKYDKKMRFLLYFSEQKIVVLEGVNSLLPFLFEM